MFKLLGNFDYYLDSNISMIYYMKMFTEMVRFRHKPYDVHRNLIRFNRTEPNPVHGLFFMNLGQKRIQAGLRGKIEPIASQVHT